MRSPAYALAWEFYCANRRGWLIMLAAIPVFALVYHALDGFIHESDGWRSFSFVPFTISLVFAMAFCNFTDRSHRNGLAGFPQHLFTLPVNTYYLVTCLMAFALISVMGNYLAWAKLVYEPLGIQLLIRWPLTLLAVAVVLYQAIIWCLSGFRLARVLVLSVSLSALVGVGTLPLFWSDALRSAIEGRLTMGLICLATIAYGVTVFTVAAQRRGGARGWAWADAVADLAAWATPGFRSPPKSADAALFWLEWRRSGLVLPAAVLLTLTLILGPILWMTGRGPDETVRAAAFLVILPMVFTLAVGKGMAKPDFWSLELALSPFLTARPIAVSQILAAKMKTAAASALVTWLLLLTIAPAWMFATCDVRNLRELWGQFQLVYSPSAELAIPILLVITVILVTWNQLVGSIWMGYCGRPGVFYSSAALGEACLIALLMLVFWWAEHPRRFDDFAVVWASRVPWLLAACFAMKVWLAAWAASHALRRKLISWQGIVRYLGFWILATGLVVTLAWLISPRVLWLRNTLILTAVLTVPLVRIAAAPLTMAANRHR
jgi:hypothetical protein